MFLGSIKNISADIKNICPEGKGCVHSPLPPFMDKGDG